MLTTMATLIFAFKANNGPVPTYLKALITTCTVPCSFQSSSIDWLDPPSLSIKKAIFRTDSTAVEEMGLSIHISQFFVMLVSMIFIWLKHLQ